MAILRDAAQVLNAAYDPNTNRLKATVVGTAGTPRPVRVDHNQIWSKIFDSATGSLRVSRIS